MATAIIQPDVIKAEIEREVGAPVDFVSQAGYDFDRDYTYLWIRFSYMGASAHLRLRDSDRALSLSDFHTRVVVPLVLEWRKAQQDA